MKYTISEKADTKIGKDMKVICGEIRKRIPNVLSILLTGGFSRGEGPAKIENRKVIVYNDYDIQVISKNKISKDQTDRISNEISKILGFKGIRNFYPFKKEEQKITDNFYIDLKVDTPEDLKKLLPRIRTIELKNNSLILFGKDIRNIIPDYRIEDIPLAEGAKLLLDRMSQMAEYYSTERIYDSEFLAYIIQQAYAACCTSLLLLNKKYEIGYTKSMKIFKENYKKDFPELYEKIPDLGGKIEQFIKWKINPEKLPEDIKKEWFTAKDNILEVSKFFFSKFLEKNITTTEELSKAIFNMNEKFWGEYLEAFLKRRFGIKIKSKILLLLLKYYLNYKYYKRLKKGGLKVIFNESAGLIIFSSLIFIISSISESKIDEKILGQGAKILNRVYPAKGNNWDEITSDYANAYIAFFLQKI